MTKFTLPPPTVCTSKYGHMRKDVEGKKREKEQKYYIPVKCGLRKRMSGIKEREKKLIIIMHWNTPQLVFFTLFPSRQQVPGLVEKKKPILLAFLSRWLTKLPNGIDSLGISSIISLHNINIPISLNQYEMSHPFLTFNAFTVVLFVLQMFPQV